MLTLSKKVSLLSAIIFGISVVVANRAVADVSQLLDIKQTDSMSTIYVISGRTGWLS